MLKCVPVTEFTVEEYLALAEALETRHGYCGGKNYDMAGSSLRHALIQMNLSAALHQLAAALRI
jgi:hypothetical protein